MVCVVGEGGWGHEGRIQDSKPYPTFHKQKQIKPKTKKQQYTYSIKNLDVNIRRNRQS